MSRTSHRNVIELVRLQQINQEQLQEIRTSIEHETTVLIEYCRAARPPCEIVETHQAYVAKVQQLRQELAEKVINNYLLVFIY